MCMLSFFPGGIMPERAEIENGAYLNPNGHGFALITERNHMMIFRSMDAEETIDRFMKARSDHKSRPAIFHSRIATSGRVDITGCHPFRVGRDNRTVLGHNGILFNPDKDSLRSDTAIFADLMLPRYGSLDKPRVIARIEKEVGSYNKLVVLTVNPNRRKQAYLINERQGHWTDNGWHSNYDFEGKWWDSPAARRVATLIDSREPYKCETCGCRETIDSDTMICTNCNVCADCLQWEDFCQCWYAGRNARTPKAITSGTGYPVESASEIVRRSFGAMTMNT